MTNKEVMVWLKKIMEWNPISLCCSWHRKRNELKFRRAVHLLIGFIMLLFFLPNTVAAKRTHHEKWYIDKWCAGRGQTEVVLYDNTRCDCVTDSHAVEADFANKFFEAIGQSLYYGLQTGKRSGILLIIEHPEDRKYWFMLNSVILHYDLPIDAWAISTGGFKI